MGGGVDERCGGGITGTLGDDGGVNVEKGGISGREIVCLCGKSGNGGRGAYMFAKTRAIFLSAACCTSPMMLSGVG